ncbi:MAG: adenylate kinase [Patescibacteria group bacterium]|jgi:adenylate kinase
MFNIIMIGPQGSGKGTQSEKMSEKLGIPTISLGKLFRAEIERNTGLGRDLAGYIERGELVPTDLVNQVMAERLTEEDTVGGFIVDGYPRTKDQAEALDELMTKINRQVTHVISLDIADDEAVRRLSGRRVCSNQDCELNYHIEFNPPKGSPDKCDRCGSPLIQRADDTPEVIRQRLSLYHHDTQPLIDFYSARGLVRRIDGTRPIAEVEAAIAAALGV